MANTLIYGCIRLFRTISSPALDSLELESDSDFESPDGVLSKSTSSSRKRSILTRLEIKSKLNLYE